MDLPAYHKAMADPRGRVKLASWSCAEVCRWLVAVVGCAEAVDAFRENCVVGADLLTITSADLKDELGIRAFGTRKKILAALEVLRVENAVEPSSAGEAIASSSVAQVDMVPSSATTAMSTTAAATCIADTRTIATSATLQDAELPSYAPLKSVTALPSASLWYGSDDPFSPTLPASPSSGIPLNEEVPFTLDGPGSIEDVADVANNEQRMAAKSPPPPMATQMLVELTMPLELPRKRKASLAVEERRKVEAPVKKHDSAIASAVVKERNVEKSGHSYKVLASTSRSLSHTMEDDNDRVHALAAKLAKKSCHVPSDSSAATPQVSSSSSSSSSPSRTTTSSRAVTTSNFKSKYPPVVMSPAKQKVVPAATSLSSTLTTPPDSPLVSDTLLAEAAASESRTTLSEMSSTSSTAASSSQGAPQTLSRLASVISKPTVAPKPCNTPITTTMDPLQLQSAVSSLLAEVNAVNAPPPLNPIDINQGVHGGPAIKVHEKIARALKPHQVEGVRFLWNAVCAQDNQDVSGCILAHAMGLGKTLQTIALVHALMIASKDSPSLLPLNMRSQHLRVLIMCPVTVIDNWMQEFHQWIPPKTDSYFHLPTSTVYELKAVGPQRKSIIERWSKSGGVLLIGMEMYRDAVAAVETANGDDYRACLLDPHLVVVDEAHRLKNAKAELSLLLKGLKSKSRICLTGYPLQNNLEEYWTMVNFIREDYLGDLGEFRRNYVIPINNGTAMDSSPAERLHGRRKLWALRKLLDKLVLRVDVDDKTLARGVFALTAKREFVIECRLTSLQQDLYIALLSKYGVPTKPRSMPFSNMISVRDTNAAISAHNLLGKCHELLLVVNHPQIFRQVHDKRLSKPAVFPNSSSSQPIITIDDDSDDTEPESNKIPQPRCERTLEPVNLMNDIMTGVTTRLDSEASDDNQARPPAAQVTATTVNEERLSSEKTIQKILVAARDIASIEHSVKIQVALAIITKARRIGDKVLLFSRSIPTLDYLERCLDSITGENAIKFVRLDGDVASVRRQELIDNFNQDDADVFLISSGVGSLGINCQSANRVILFDCGWNPSIDEQSIARAYRYGQQKNVFVYRIYSYDTIEAVLYGINQRKMALARMVVDNKARGDGESDMKHNKSCFNFYFRVPSSKNPCKLTEKSNDWDDEIISSVATDLKSGIIDIRQHRTYETLDELSSSEKAEAEDWLRAEVRRKSLKKLAADRKCKEQRQ